MARFTDPLSKLVVNSSTTDDEYLTVRLKNFRNLTGNPQAFYDAIEGLIKMQSILCIASRADLLDESPFKEVSVGYKQIINWLKGDDILRLTGTNSPYSNQRRLGAIDDYSKIDETQADGLLKFVNHLARTMNSHQLVQVIKLTQATIIDKEFRNVKSQSERLTNELQELYENAQADLKVKVAGALKDISDKATNEADAAKDILKAETGIALNKIEVAQVMEIWNENYLRQIKDCEEKLYGDKSRVWHKWIYNRTVPFAARRFWFLAFLGIASITVCYIVINIILEPYSASETFTVAKILAYVGLLLIPSIMYSSANKSYRVYLNQLDEYKQRAVVAKTLQGMLSYIDEKEENRDIRVNIASTAAASMFGIRNTGHLVKRGDESSFLDFASSIINKR